MDVLGLTIYPDVYENGYVADYKDPVNEVNFAPQKALLYRNLLGNCTIIFTRTPSKPLSSFQQRVAGYDRIKFVIKQKVFTEEKGEVLSGVDSRVVVAFGDGYDRGFLILLERLVEKLEAEGFEVKVLPLTSASPETFARVRKYRHKGVVFVRGVARKKVVSSQGVKEHLIDLYLHEQAARFVVFSQDGYFWSRRGKFLSMDSAKYRWVYVFYFKGGEVFPCPYRLSQPVK